MPEKGGTNLREITLKMSNAKTLTLIKKSDQWKGRKSNQQIEFETESRLGYKNTP
jgi:hypothetical protein